MVEGSRGTTEISKKEITRLLPRGQGGIEIEEEGSILECRWEERCVDG